MPQQTITLEVFRYRPDEEEQSTFQSYDVPYHGHWVVLDALNWIKDNVDGTLSYRWSCRMGVCGSCGMMLNGDPKLSCAAFLKDYFPGAIRVEPLANFPVERDLVIDMDGFMEKLKTVKPWIIRDDIDHPAATANAHSATHCVQAVFHVHQLHALLLSVPGTGRRPGIPRPGSNCVGAPIQPRLAR